MRKCQASNRNYEKCLLLGSTTSELENQYLCPVHAEEYRLCYVGYKDLQRKLEGQKYPESPSAGGTGRVKAMPGSKGEILSCKQPTVLQRLQEYYRERSSLLKRNIDTRKLVMRRFFSIQDRDRGHVKAIEDLQIERNKIKDLLFYVETQLHKLTLPKKKRAKLGRWLDKVKEQIEFGEKNAGPTHNVAQPDTNQQMFVKQMEALTVQIASPEEEPDPLAAELAARRQELLGDFWFFLRYRFQLQFEESNGFLHLAACIFRRIVLATPGALILTKAHSSIRSFLEDESINIEILQDLWDLMQKSPARLIWDAITDYRTFFNTQFEENVHEVPDDKKLFILGGYVHLEDAEISASSSPEVSWTYLISFAGTWYPLQELQVLARTFHEALILKQLMYFLDFPRWGFFWKLLESVLKTKEMRFSEEACTFSNIIVKQTCEFNLSPIRLVPPPPGFDLGPESTPLIYVETKSRPFVFFQIGTDDPYALPLIEEFKRSPQFHAVWAKNAKTGEVVCAPPNQKLWTKLIRWAPFKIEEFARGIPDDTPFIVQETLAEYLAKLEEGKWETVGLTVGLDAARQETTELMSKTYKDYFLVLVISLKEHHGLQMLLDDLWINAGIVRDQEMSNGRIWQGDRYKMIELLNSHPFFRKFCVEDKLLESQNFKPRKSPSINRPTTWPKEAYTHLDELTKAAQSILSGSTDPLPPPSHGTFNGEHLMIDSRILARKLEAQGVLETDTSTAIDTTNVPLGFGFHIPTKGGLYIEFAQPNIPKFTCATLRPSKLVLGPSDTIVSFATKYQQNNRNASFTLCFLRSEAFHWPFKFEKPLPYYFHIGADTRVYTTRYLLKDAPGSNAAVHGYLNHSLMGLADSIIWRDVILFMKPNPKAKMRLNTDYPQRAQGSADLARDMERLASRSQDIWENIFCQLNIPLARAYAPRKVTPTLKFEVLGAKSVAAVREAMDAFLAREW